MGWPRTRRRRPAKDAADDFALTRAEIGFRVAAATDTSRASANVTAWPRMDAAQR